MDLESMKQLEYDVRMLQRRGWITKDKLEKQLENLPDVSEKAVSLEVARPDAQD